MMNYIFTLFLLVLIGFKSFSQCDFVIQDSLLTSIVFYETAKPYFVDIDNDGDQDVFLGENNGAVYYYKNIGTLSAPLFRFQNGSDNPFDGVDIGTESTIAFVDLDNDNDQDAFVGEAYGVMYYYKNTGTPSKPVFSLKTGSSNPLNSVFVGYDCAPFFADIDNDGDQDACIGSYYGTLTYYKNTGTSSSPVFSLQTGSSDPFNGVSVTYESAPYLVDIDGDNDLDVFIGEYYGSMAYYKNTGTSSNPTFTLQTGSNDPFDGLDVGDDCSPSFADIDNDGDYDAFIGKKTGNLLFYKNTGSATSYQFDLQTVNSNPLVDVYVGLNNIPALVDIDNDGDQDAFFGEYNGTIYYYKNTGSSSNAVFVEKTGSDNPLDAVNAGFNSTPSFVDIDKDGDQDVFIGTLFGTFYYYENTGTANNAVFSLQGWTTNPLSGKDVGGSSTPTFVDIDGDGDYDAFSGKDLGTISYYKNTGADTLAVFTEQTGSNNLFNGQDVGSYSNLAFIDFDNDGDYDAFIGAADGEINYYENTGTSTSPAFVSQTGSDNPFNGMDVGAYSALNFADIDNDYDKDIFIGEYEGTVLFIPYNCDSAITTSTFSFVEPIPSFNLYPNPTQNTFTIDMGNSTSETYGLEIIDMLGNVVWTQSVTRANTTIDAKQLTRGTYLVRISDEENISVVQKLVLY